MGRRVPRSATYRPSDNKLRCYLCISIAHTCLPLYRIGSIFIFCHPQPNIERRPVNASFPVLQSLFYMNIKTLIAVLFWGNLVSLGLVLAFRHFTPFSRDRRHTLFFNLARALQAVAWLLLLLRGQAPDILSVNLGNTCLLLGFYYEARCMLHLIQAESTLVHRLGVGITAVCVILFNTAETLWPGEPGFRVAIASLCVFLTLCIPVYQLFRFPDTSTFRITIGVFYLLFLSLLLPRTAAAIVSPMDVLSNTLIQTLTFLSLVMLQVFSYAAYLLILKEESDKQLHDMTTRDALTGLPNRKTFLASARLMFQRHTDRKAPLSIIVLALDDFRAVNNVWGDGFEDFFLKSFAAAIRETLRSADIPCRYRDEEFLIMLPESDAKTAKNIGAQITLCLKKKFLQQETGLVFTVSGGVASSVPRRGATLEEMIRRAYLALHIAKTTGENNITIWK